MTMFCGAFLFWIHLSTLSQGLSLPSALEQAKQHHPALKRAMLSLEQANNTARLSQGQRLPEVSSSVLATQDHSEGFTSGDSGHFNRAQSSASVDLAWTIYSGGRFSANDQKWRGEQTLSEHQAQLLLQQLMVDVALAYFNLVQQQAIEQVAEKNVQLSRDRHEKAQTRQSLGQDSQSQLLDAYSALLSDEASLAEQRERVTEALALLKQRMFYPLDDALTIQMDALPDIPPVGDLDSWLQLAREHNLALKELNAQETVLEAAVAEAQSAFRPTLTFQSGLAYGDSRFALSGVNTNAHQATWDLALVGSIDLFDGYQRKTTLANRTIDVAQTQWLRKQELHELDHEVKKWHQQLTQQQLRVQHQQNTLATAQTYLQLQEERFQMGLIDALSFRDAQLRLARSAQGLIAAQFDALNSYLQLLRLTADAEAIGSLSP